TTLVSRSLPATAARSSTPPTCVTASAGARTGLASPGPGDFMAPAPAAGSCQRSTLKLPFLPHDWFADMRPPYTDRHSVIYVSTYNVSVQTWGREKATVRATLCGRPAGVPPI